MTPSRFRLLLAALAAFATILLQTPAQARSPAKPAVLPDKAPACLLTLEVRQLHWTLDPLEHAKDHINALQFDLPADPAFCKDVTVGTVLDEKFRWGSWLFRQNYGQWSVRVVGKRINGVSEGAVPVPQASTVPPPMAPSAVMPAPAANAPARPSTAPYDPGPAPALEPLVKPAGDTRQP